MMIDEYAYKRKELLKKFKHLTEQPSGPGAAPVLLAAAAGDDDDSWMSSLTESQHNEMDKELAKLDKKAQHEYELAALDGDEELQERKDEYAHKRYEVKEHYKRLSQQPAPAEMVNLAASADLAGTDLASTE